jgi:hypothetical protein
LNLADQFLLFGIVERLLNIVAVQIVCTFGNYTFWSSLEQNSVARVALIIFDNSRHAFPFRTELKGCNALKFLTKDI